MDRGGALRLIAEGKTGEAIDCLLTFIEEKCLKEDGKISDEYLEVLMLSYQYHRTEKAFLGDIIKYDDFSISMNKITRSFLGLIKSGIIA
ncbi:MAG: hypothetical protein LCH81_05670 [Bacteroidetes bacterium]|nr:hypothetical protein [Bacteroidota bacterium]